MTNAKELLNTAKSNLSSHAKFTELLEKVSASVEQSIEEFDAEKAIETAKTIAYNVAIVIGAVIYLTYLMARATVSAGRAVKAFWVRHRIGLKIKSAIEAQPSLNERIAEVRQGYAAFGAQVIATVESAKNDYQTVKQELIGDRA